MPNQDSGKTPSPDPQEQPVPQHPVTPTTPQENKMGKDSQCSSSDENDKTTKLQQDIRRGEYWLIGISGAAFVLNIVIAVIYYGQLHQMRKATKATQTAAEAAKNSADLQRTIVEGTQTAEVMPQELNLDDRKFLRVSVMNVGGVASAKSSVDIEVSRQHLPDKLPLGTTQVFHFTVDSLRARQSSGAHVFEILGYTQKDKWNIYHKRQAIIINMTVEFENGFGKWGQRKSCNEYLSIYGPKDHPQVPEMAGCYSVAMRLEQVLPPEQRAWKWQQ